MSLRFALVPLFLYVRILSVPRELRAFSRSCGLLEAELELECRYLALSPEFFPGHFQPPNHQGPFVITAV